MTQATILAEWGTFLSGMAAALAFAAPWIIRIIEKRNKKQITQAIDSWYFSKLKEGLASAADRAGPDRTRIIDIKFLNPDVLIRLPVILDKWLTVLPGCDIIGDQFSAEKTVYLLRTDNTTRIRRHTHEGAESVLVIIGSMRDPMTGRVYQAGETWQIPEGVVHSVVFEAPEDNSSHGLFMVTVTPPLPTSAQVLLQLDGLAALAG